MANRNRPASRERIDAAIVAAVTLACLLPFLGKAFHVDDPLFLWTARQIRSAPLDFFGFDVNWYGSTTSIAEITKNPPGTAYALALASALFGWSEPALHGAFLVPALLAAWGTYRLARRLSPAPLAAALAAVLTPAFVVSSTSVMSDTMLLAGWVWALEFWLDASASGRPSRYALAALLVTAATLAKYFALALVPLCALHAIVRTRTLPRAMAWLAVPVGAAAAFQALTAARYGEGALGAAASYAWTEGYAAFADLPARAWATLTFTGGCLALPLIASPWLVSRRVVALGAGLAAAAGVVLALAGRVGPLVLQPDGDLRLGLVAQIALMALGGAVVLALAIDDVWRRRDADAALLAAWVVGTLLFVVAVNWTVSARNLLPLAPAAGILVTRRLHHDAGCAGRAALRRLGPALALAAVLALAVAVADASWANSARAAAHEIARRATTYPVTLRFQGHWGFQYYMEGAGFSPAETKAAPPPGEGVVVPLWNTNVEAPPPETVTLLDAIEVPKLGGLSTFNVPAGACFYTHLAGPLPYAFAPGQREAYLIVVAR